MKKKVLMLVVVLVLCVASLAGCVNAETSRVYSRNVADMDALAVAANGQFKLPTIKLEGENKFYDPAVYKDVVSVPAEAKNNEIVLLYIPNINAVIESELAGKVDERFYRYSIKLTLDKSYGDVYEQGKVEIYLHGSNYNRIDKANFSKVDKVSLEDRKAKMDKDNKGDMNKIQEAGYTEAQKAKFWESNVVDNVYKYSNRNDGQVMRYYVNDTANTAYETTACIYVGDKVGEGLGKEEKQTAIDSAYEQLLDAATIYIDALLAQVIG